MGKIFVLIGKSASGKDTIYARLIADPSLSLKPYVIHTTRPKREGETEGVEYHFTDLAFLQACRQEGSLVESRVYHTVYGDWYYFTVADDAVDPEKHDYLYIGTLESFEKMREYFGSDTVVPIYVEVEDGVRLERALKRERERTKPGYAEMCRRFLTDEEDFSEEKLAGAGIRERFENVDGDACFEKIREMILLCQK